MNDGLTDRKAETGTAGIAGPRGITAVKAVEDVGQSRSIDSFAMIFDFNLKTRARSTCIHANVDNGAGSTVLYGIENEIGEEQ